MGDGVTAAHRPEPGCEARRDALVRDHVPRLRRLQLATDRTPVIARAEDGRSYAAVAPMPEDRDA